MLGGKAFSLRTKRALSDGVALVDHHLAVLAVPGDALGQRDAELVVSVLFPALPLGGLNRLTGFVCDNADLLLRRISRTARAKT